MTVLKTDDYTIRWIGEIKGEVDVTGERPIVRKFFDVIAGKQRESLIKPISVIDIPRQKIVILDQGARRLITVDLMAKKYNSFIKQEYASLVSMTSLPDGTILSTDSQRNLILSQKFSGEHAAVFNTDHPLQQPTGIVYSPHNKLIYVAETAAHCLSIFDIHGRFVKSIGQRGKDLGKFNFPTFLAINDIGNIYVVDSMNFRIQIFNPDGEVITSFGKAGDASGDLARPKGIAFDTFGHIYVVDGLFHNVQVFNDEGDFLAYFGQQGQGPGEFWMPAGISIDEKNNIYVADTYNNRIQIFQLEVMQ